MVADKENCTLADVLENCIGFFEAYRRLGFLPDEIFFVTDAVFIGMQIHRGGQVFGVAAGPRKDFDGGEIETQWLALCNRWNSSMTPAEREVLWQKSWACNNAGRFVSMMVHHGVLPDSNRSIDMMTPMGRA